MTCVKTDTKTQNLLIPNDTLTQIASSEQLITLNSNNINNLIP